MNFLAHCALAEDASEVWDAQDDLRAGLLAGALIGDFVKGVRVHRRVDACSNQDQFAKACSNRFPPELRRFAPIFVDLIADHHLCRDWHRHYPRRDLATFAQQCYAAIELYDRYLPAHGRRFFAYMLEENLLLHYDKWEHLERGLYSVMRRLQRSEMAASVIDTTQHLIPQCQQDCAALHQQLQQQWQSWTLD